MTDRQRIILFILVLCVLVILGLVFAPYVIEHILKPLSVAAWLFLRIFVLSISQYIYWGLLILIAVIWLVRRLVVRGAEPVALADTVPNEAVMNIEKWMSSMTLAANYLEWRQQLKNELIQMLVALFSSRQQGLTYSEVFEPLRQRQIPLPDPVYDFLLLPQTKDIPLTFVQKLRSLPDLPRRWWRKWSGQETAEYHRSIEIVLNTLETMLENSNDIEPSNHNNH
ncbi:MAG: hypothetical protein JW987_05165 [Anaerolineaceae bacterium]|nr:hypothetical protein [Anaerolineaceae bacterium]